MKHLKLLISIAILGVTTSVFIHSQGRTTIDGSNPQLPTALGINGGLKVEGIAGGVSQPVSATQTTSPWVDNISQFGGVAVSTGIGPAGTGIPRVTESNDDLTGTVSLSSGAACPAASASLATTSAGCIQIPLAGYAGAAIEIQVGTLAATLSYEYSIDGGATWGAAFVNSGGLHILSSVITNPNPLIDANFVIGPGWSHIRVRVSSFTSGTAVSFGRATKIVSPLAVGALTNSFVGIAPTSFVGMVGLKANTGVPTAQGTGTAINATADVYGAQFVRVDHPNRVKCVLTTTNATSTIVTGCAAPTAGLSIYVTDISQYGGATHTATTASTVQSGTGGTCGTGTTVLNVCQHGALAGCESHYLTPLRAGTISEVCILDATVGTKWITISGYIAP